MSANAPKRQPQKRKMAIVRPSEAMQRWSVLMEQEMAGWPKFGIKRFFGMKGLYRDKAIFAALPDKWSFFSPDSIIIKLQNASLAGLARMKEDKRITLDFGKKQKWYAFELSNDRDLNGALEWLGEAYEMARPAAAKKKKK